MFGSPYLVDPFRNCFKKRKKKIDRREKKKQKKRKLRMMTNRQKIKKS